jgi:hypothetical protein
MNSFMFFRTPSLLKPGEPGNRENLVSMRVRGLPVLLFGGFAKPGNRENRTVSEAPGNVARKSEGRKSGFFARKAFPCWPPMAAGIEQPKEKQAGLRLVNGRKA